MILSSASLTVRLSVTKCIMAKGHILQQKFRWSEQEVRNRNTILQLSTPYTDHIPSNSHPKVLKIVLIYYNYLAFLIMWPFCLYC